VDGRLGIDISEGEGQVVLINDVCWNLFADDFAEKRFLSCHGCSGSSAADVVTDLTDLADGF